MLSRALVILLAVLSAAAIPPVYSPSPTSTSPSTDAAVDDHTARTTVARLATQAPALPLDLKNTDSQSPEPRSCHYTYCDEHQTRWCFYWDGVTGYDKSLGLIPGETRAYLGTCHVEPQTVAKKYCGHA